MRAAKLRHRVTIQQKAETQDPSTGEVVYGWTDYLANVPAEVLTGPGGERFSADAKQSDTTARITLRWFDGLLPTMRIIWQSKRFDILSIETDITDRRELRIRCQDGLNDGA